MLRHSITQATRPERTVKIGKQVFRLRASALSPRIYRARYGRDIFADMERVAKKYRDIIELKQDDNGEMIHFAPADLEIFSFLFHMFWASGDPKAAKTPEEMLDKISALPIMELWPTVWGIWRDDCTQLNTPAEKSPETMRRESTALYMLICSELGIHQDELDSMTCGMIFDMLAEKADDRHAFAIKGTRAEKEKLFGG